MLKYALGDEDAYKIPVSGTKGATGHCLGAAGAIEATFTILAIRDGKLPPTINYEVPDPACDLDYVPNEPRDADVAIAVSNSFGFGGRHAPAEIQREDPSRSYREVMAIALDRLGAPADEHDALGRALPGWEPFPEVPSALEEARARGWRLAILSNTDRDFIDASIARLGVPFDE